MKKYSVKISGTIYTESITWQYDDFSTAFDKYRELATEQGNLMSIWSGKVKTVLQFITPHKEHCKKLTFSTIEG